MRRIMKFTKERIHEFRNNRLNPPSRGGWRAVAPPDEYQAYLVRTIHGGRHDDD